jgi:hypothetical protein
VAFAGSNPGNTFASAGSSSLYGLRDFSGLLGGAVPAFLDRYIAGTPPAGQLVCEAIASSAVCGPRNVDPLQSFIITEKTMAGYAKVNFGTDLGSILVSGNIGIRYTIPSAVRSGPSGVPAVRSTRFLMERTCRLAAERRGRSSSARTCRCVSARPRSWAFDTIDLSPNLQLNRLSPYNGSAGNPSLKPIRADQYDASIGGISRKARH